MAVEMEQDVHRPPRESLGHDHDRLAAILTADGFSRHRRHGHPVLLSGLTGFPILGLMDVGIRVSALFSFHRPGLAGGDAAHRDSEHPFVTGRTLLAFRGYRLRALVPGVVVRALPAEGDPLHAGARRRSDEVCNGSISRQALKLEQHRHRQAIPRGRLERQTAPSRLGCSVLEARVSQRHGQAQEYGGTRHQNRGWWLAFRAPAHACLGNRGLLVGRRRD